MSTGWLLCAPPAPGAAPWRALWHPNGPLPGGPPPAPRGQRRKGAPRRRRWPRNQARGGAKKHFLTLESSSQLFSFRSPQPTAELFEGLRELRVEFAPSACFEGLREEESFTEVTDPDAVIEIWELKREPRRPSSVFFM